MAYQPNFATTPTTVTTASPASGSGSGSSQGGWGTLGTLLSIAAAVAIPVVSPAIAGAIFGTSAMAAWGGVGGVLASAGVGAALGGAVGAGTAALSGGNVGSGALMGALTGGLGGGVGAAVPLLSSALGGATSAATAATQAAPLVGVGSASAGLPAAAGGAAGGGLSTGLSAAAPATGLGGLGAAFGGIPWDKLPWDKVQNAVLGAAPDLVGSLVSDFMPPSAETQARVDAINAGLKTQEESYAAAQRAADNLDPNYWATTAANNSRIRSGAANNQLMHDLALQGGATDPARAAAETRRNNIGGAMASGQAYNDAYLTALQGQLGAQQVAAGLRPNYSDYAKMLADYGVDAEKKKRAEEIAALLGQVTTPFLKSNTTAQAGTSTG